MRLFTKLYQLLRKHPELLYLLLFAVNGIGYFVVQELSAHHTVIHTTLDDAIPFLPVFIVPYILWYIYVPLLMFVTCLNDTRSYRKQCIAMFGGVWFCFLLFLLFPTAIDFRPQKLGSDIFSRLCALIYANDGAYNVCPSLHCYEAALVHVTTFRYSNLKKRKGYRTLSAILMVLICMSTVFVKQHSVVDIFAGVGLVIPVCYLVYRRKSI